ncbi:phosphoesterase RecJ-like protein [Deinobacterium chartae]|uniref:Phosphoesterase RecJ-like protein n=1 Tax=Deinobacterium chartae TaxID=521158 RepID=A0A841HXU0_9DEIO|nr:DHH family phosphoesterase [Deinobacterium chartae]MBB6097020.1 phosphoesterase RecJ-like protein [Deinobacterium chartae]
MSQSLFQTPETDYAGKLAAIAAKLRGHDGFIAIVSHVEADGDALGSCLGLQRALTALGKDARTFMNVPRYLRFLPREGEVLAPVSRIGELPENTLLVVLDVDNNDHVRVEGAPTADFDGFVINVDHHGTNRRQASLSLVEPAKAAAALMIKELVDALEVSWTAGIAHPVLTGIITDTGSFKFSNTTPEVLRTAAKLVEYGADLAGINDNLAQQPRNYYPLLGSVLRTVEYGMNDLVVSAHVNEAMLQEVGAGWEEVESFVSVIRSAEGTELAALFKDFGDHVKLSLRSRGRVSAQNIAVACGGGGHVAAAGATMHMPYAEARARFEEQARLELKRVGLL